ncbi:cyclin-Q-like [Chamaea fasciata]|uniref:cyclin-Q-like n=1 Tax=Chamaea fasciata TaxID=190680 RepID=UPI00336A7E63
MVAQQGWARISDPPLQPGCHSCPGVKLGLGSAALATACGSFHAFAAAAAPGAPQDRYLVAAAALFVAAKAQGTPRRARDVLNVTLRCLHPGDPPPRPWTGIFGGSGTVSCSVSCCCCGCCASGCRWRTPTSTCCSTCWRWAAGGGGPWGRVPGVSWALLRDGAAGGLGLRHPPPHLAAAALHLGLELCGRGGAPRDPPEVVAGAEPGVKPLPRWKESCGSSWRFTAWTRRWGGGATPAPPPPLPPSPPPRRPSGPPARQAEPPPPQRDGQTEPLPPSHRQTEGPPPNP